MTIDQNITVPDLLTPCCNAPLLVYTAWAGGGGGDREFVDYIECDNCDNCWNTWTPTGVSNSNNKMPGDQHDPI